MFERKDIKDDIYILWFPSFHTPHSRMISLRGVMIKCQNRTDLLSQKPLKKKKKWQSWRLCEEINFHIYLHIFSPWSYTCMTMQTVLCFNPLASLLGVENMAIFYGFVARQIFMLIMQTTNLQLWIKYEGGSCFVVSRSLSISSGLALVSLYSCI